MNLKARRRAMRSFLATLLQLEMTSDEMNELAEELTHGNLAQELGDFIRDAMPLLSESRYSRIDSDQMPPNALQAFELITRRRLSKKFVLDIMTLVSPWLKSQKVQSDGTVRDLLERYFAVAPVAEARKFINTLQGETSDPYLKGITRRR